MICCSTEASIIPTILACAARLNPLPIQLQFRLCAITHLFAKTRDSSDDFALA
jgi:hypothetical protein